MTWHEVRVQAVAPQIRETINPSDLTYPLVEHYSIPSLEATGQPELIHPEEILSDKQLLRGGEVMLSRLNPRKGRVLKVPAQKEYPVVASGEFIVMRTVNIEADYLVYLLSSEEIRQYLNSCVQSVTRSHQRIRPEHLLKLLIRIPNRKTQIKIAKYLDRETGKVDVLVERKRLLLERLAEYRAALITRTVTRGLPPQAAQAAGFNPSPCLKYSGVEWLGDIPKHWEVRRLGNVLVETVGGGTPSTANELYWADENEGGLPWVAIADMSDGGNVVTTAKCVTRLGCSAARLRSLPPGTIIYSMYASVGVVARLQMYATTNQAILGLLPETILQSNFLYWWLAAIRSPVLALTRDNTQSNLNAETVRKIPIALPPLEEQQAIAEYLDARTQRIDRLCQRVENAIERLQEFRTALVTAAVTGEIDVRDSQRVKTERAGR